MKSIVVSPLQDKKPRRPTCLSTAASLQDVAARARGPAALERATSPALARALATNAADYERREARADSARVGPVPSREELQRLLALRDDLDAQQKGQEDRQEDQVDQEDRKEDREASQEDANLVSPSPSRKRTTSSTSHQQREAPKPRRKEEEASFTFKKPKRSEELHPKEARTVFQNSITVNLDGISAAFNRDVKNAGHGVKAEIEKKSNVCQETLSCFKASLQDLTEDCAALIESASGITGVIATVLENVNKITQEAAKHVGRIKAAEHRVDEAIKDLKALGAATTDNLRRANEKQHLAAHDHNRRVTELLRKERVIP